MKRIRFVLFLVWIDNLQKQSKYIQFYNINWIYILKAFCILSNITNKVTWTHCCTAIGGISYCKKDWFLHVLFRSALFPWRSHSPTLTYLNWIFRNSELLPKRLVRYYEDCYSDKFSLGWLGLDSDFVIGMANVGRNSKLEPTRSSAIAGRPCDAKACQA